MTEGTRLIVADANVYVDAVVHDESKVLGEPPSLAHIPSLPPRTVHPALHVLGVVRDGTETGTGPGLAVSDHILLMVVHALRRHDWPSGAIRAYAYAIRALAERSTGGYYTDVPRTQHDCPDHEDNLYCVRTSLSALNWYEDPGGCGGGVDRTRCEVRSAALP